MVSLFDIWEPLNGKGKWDGFHSQRRISGFDLNSKEVAYLGGIERSHFVNHPFSRLTSRKVYDNVCLDQNFHYNINIEIF